MYDFTFIIGGHRFNEGYAIFLNFIYHSWDYIQYINRHTAVKRINGSLLLGIQNCQIL